MTLAGASTTGPDLLRLVAVPVFAWIAVRDIRTRRVSSTVWIPLAVIGAVVLVWDGWLAWSAGGFVWSHEFLIPTAISLGLVVPLGYLFWRIGGFGFADASAFFVLALLFPTFPQYIVGPWTLPLSTTPIGAFSLTVLTNAVLVGAAIPLALAARNAAAGRFAPVMVVGWPISWDRVPETHGKLISTASDSSLDSFDLDTIRVSLRWGGLDLDALRMYLRWRGLSLADVRENPDRFRNPVTLPNEPNPPTDGAVTADIRDGRGTKPEHGSSEDTDLEGESTDGTATYDHNHDHDDPWGADAFLEDIEGSAYGTSPDELRDGLEVLAEQETVWISPGTPFLVPVFLGLVIALGYGDLLVGTLV